MSPTHFQARSLTTNLSFCLRDTYKRPVRKQVINDAVLDDPDLQLHVTASVFECYLHHATINDHLTAIRKTDLLTEIGRIFVNLERVRVLINDSIDAQDLENLRDMYGNRRC